MIARPFGSALIVGLLLAAVSSVPASAQLIALKTVPVAAGDQFLQTPSDKLGMGGLAIAIADTLGDPFVNPATGARVRESQVFAVPTYYSISNNAGSARTLPFGMLVRAGQWFGGVSVALQQLKTGDEMFAQVMLALWERERTGQGKMVDVSMAHCAARAPPASGL